MFVFHSFNLIKDLMEFEFSMAAELYAMLLSVLLACVLSYVSVFRSNTNLVGMIRLAGLILWKAK